MTQERMREDALQLLREMICIPSPSFEEHQVCRLLGSRLREWGIECEEYGCNLVARCPDFNPARRTLELDAHMDTVPPSADYTRNSFDPMCDPDIIFGLGSNDDGGSVVAMAAAFRHFYGMSLPFNLVLALTCEEERSGEGGAKWLYGENGPLRDADWVIVGEPTGMKAAVSERGLLVLDAVAHGISGHAARGEGVNALYIALEDIEALRSHRFGRISPTMGEVRLNVTQIQAGKAHNVIPDFCSFVVDIRPTDSYTCAEILSELQPLCRSSLTARNLNNRSSATRVESPLLRTARRLGLETFSSPTTSDWMRISCDAIKMGPGDSARSHHADEYILCSEVSEAIGKYITFINSLYGDTLE